MSVARLTPRVQATPIRLKPDRFEALVCAHEAFLAGRPGGRRATLSFIVAQGYRCDRRQLADAKFDGADLSGTSFVGSELSRSSLYCANLTGCDFRQARMLRADLRGATFNGANLSGANLDGADMRAAVLWASDDVRGLRWVGGRSNSPAPIPEGGNSGPVTYSVDFSNCSLQGAQMRDANLKNANFAGANLNGADLVGARLEGVHLRGAILTGIDVRKLTVAPSALAECVFDPTAEARARVDEVRRELDRAQDWITTGGDPASLVGFDLRPAAEHFRGRLLSGMQAKSVVAIGVDFSGAQLQGANFEDADLRAANFAGADLRGASFANANLSHANFEGAVIGELELRPGLALPTRFDRAMLDGTGLGEDAP